MKCLRSVEVSSNQICRAISGDALGIPKPVSFAIVPAGADNVEINYIQSLTLIIKELYLSATLLIMEISTTMLRLLAL
jgi:hypothetical protein